MIESVPPVVGSCSRGSFRLIYPQSQSLLLLVSLLLVLLLVGGFTLHVSEGGGGSLCTCFHGKGGFTLHVENSAESHKPVEIGDLRAQGASRSREGGRLQTGQLRPSGAILAPGKGYSTRRGGSDDGAMAGAEGCRIRTPGAAE